MHLYDNPDSGNRYKVRLLLAQPGIPYDRRELSVSNRSNREEVLGERYSIADIALYAYTHAAGEGGFDLARYPAVQAWLERVVAAPGHVKLKP